MRIEIREESVIIDGYAPVIENVELEQKWRSRA